jgi:hypothetical protein
MRIRRLFWGHLLAAPLLAMVACQSINPWPGEFEDCGPEPELTAHDPYLGKELSVLALARDLDHLEKHIDWFGSVTPKVPDVWGQARLQQYREDFEREMYKDIGNFHVLLNGSLSRSDQSYFSYAQTLAIAAAGASGAPLPVPAAAPPASTVSSSVTKTTTPAPAPAPAQAPNPAPPPAPAAAGKSAPPANGGTVTQTAFAAADTSSPPSGSGNSGAARPMTQADDPSALVNLAKDQGIITRTDAKVEMLKPESTTIALEPTLQLAQKKRYLDFLNQLRRENEGDDTADSPGYSLNLMRIPVSVLPGTRTQKGFGAEATFTLNPILGDDLLPVTFRNLVTNDLAFQIGLPLTQILDPTDTESAVQPLLKPDFQEFVRIVTLVADYLSNGMEKQARDFACSLTPRQRALFTTIATDEMCAVMCVWWSECKPEKGQDAPNEKIVAGPKPTGGKPGAAQPFTLTKVRAFKTGRRNFPSRFNVPALSFSSGLDNKTPFPTSQLLDVYGESFCFEIAYGAHQSLAAAFRDQGYAHLPDVQSFLKEEVNAAYEFLKAHPDLMTAYCTPTLAQLIRGKRLDDVDRIRRAYRMTVEHLTDGPEPWLNNDTATKRQYSVTAALAWCVIVDSALLTERLVQDMKEVASARGACLPQAGVWLPYFLPDPPCEARQAFNDYVRIRWPIHVFALDPETQEQNISDELATRREMQLALSIAFTSGNIGSRQLLQYARRLEADYSTIAINRTQVGFSYGENVFGWRFYPRFQSPDTPSNLTVLFRDTLVGGPNRNQLLRDRRLEPGMRECVAVVMMPSFVPYVSVEAASNWFPLANPKHKVLDLTQAMHLSREIKAIQVGGCGVTDANCYRDGDWARLLQRAEQLEARLPLQTMNAPVPVVNTLGGFEMFSNGTTDFAPELYGFYGAPGISPGAETTLFLVGNHFSPLRTQVIAGNQLVTAQKLLSRQVIQVTVSAKAVAIPDIDEYRVHLATPYGVSRELSVPVVKPPSPKPAPAEGYSIAPESVKATYKLTPEKDGKFSFAFDRGKIGPMKVTFKDNSGSAPAQINVQFVFAIKKTEIKLPTTAELAQFDKGAYVLNKDAIDNVLAGIEALYKTSTFTPDTLPFADFAKTIRIEITPVQGKDLPPVHASQTVNSLNQLSIEFSGRIEPKPPDPKQPGGEAGVPLPLPDFRPQAKN